MRTTATILDEFDNPEAGVDKVDSTVSSTRQRLPIEVLCDIRTFAVGIPATHNSTTAVHIIGFIAEKITAGTYAAVYYIDSTGVLAIESDLSKLVVTV